MTENDELPSEVRGFIRQVTLFLQQSREKTEGQMDAMFREAYRLYVKYDVEREVTHGP